MRRLTLLTLVLLNSCGAGNPASKPVQAAPSSQCSSCPASAAASSLPVVEVTGAVVEVPVAPASQPVRDPPVYTRGQVAMIIAGAEYEKGDIARDRDKFKEAAKLAAAYAERLKQELDAAQVRASWLPWTVGAAALIVGALGGVVAGAVWWHEHQAQQTQPPQPVTPAQ